MTQTLKPATISVRNDFVVSIPASRGMYFQLPNRCNRSQIIPNASLARCNPHETRQRSGLRVIEPLPGQLRQFDLALPSTCLIARSQFGRSRHQRPNLSARVRISNRALVPGVVTASKSALAILASCTNCYKSPLLACQMRHDPFAFERFAVPRKTNGLPLDNKPWVGRFTVRQPPAAKIELVGKYRLAKELKLTDFRDERG